MQNCFLDIEMLISVYNQKYELTIRKGHSYFDGRYSYIQALVSLLIPNCYGDIENTLAGSEEIYITIICD